MFKIPAVSQKKPLLFIAFFFIYLEITAGVSAASYSLMVCGYVLSWRMPLFAAPSPRGYHL